MSVLTVTNTKTCIHYQQKYFITVCSFCPLNYIYIIHSLVFFSPLFIGSKVVRTEKEQMHEQTDASKDDIKDTFIPDTGNNLPLGLDEDSDYYVYNDIEYDRDVIAQQRKEIEDALVQDVKGTVTERVHDKGSKLKGTVEHDESDVLAELDKPTNTFGPIKAEISVESDESSVTDIPNESYGTDIPNVFKNLPKKSGPGKGKAKKRRSL